MAESPPYYYVDNKFNKDSKNNKIYETIDTHTYIYSIKHYTMTFALIRARPSVGSEIPHSKIYRFNARDSQQRQIFRRVTPDSPFPAVSLSQHELILFEMTNVYPPIIFRGQEALCISADWSSGSRTGLLGRESRIIEVQPLGSSTQY